MTSTIFPICALERQQVRWEDHLHALTPWELRQGIWFKREDHFAPLGYGGPNGSKMRQLIWYFSQHRGNRVRVVTGASVQSPQLSMTAIVGAHFGMETLAVVYSRPSTVRRHVNPRIAAGFGAEFDYAKGPYNPIIQARVRDLSAPDALTVHYGIGMPQEEGFGPSDWKAFHAVGAHQVSNLPADLRNLIVPAGSCNSLASVLLGLSRDPGNLRTLLTLGIGPDKRAWLGARLAAMGVDVDALPFSWLHYSLHETGYSAYSDQFKGEGWDGIEFHPTYEAKMWRWLREHTPIRQDGQTGLWIVGSAADPKVTEPFYTHELPA